MTTSDKERILLVEDDPDVARMVSYQLEREGYGWVEEALAAK